MSCPRSEERDVLDDDEVARIDAYWRAANHLSAGRIYLRANPLLRGTWPY